MMVAVCPQRPRPEWPQRTRASGHVSNPGLYVHVPFCRSKCGYCGFYSVVAPDWEPRWLAALAREARHYAGQWPEFDTCYVGGGTPSVVESVTLSRLVQVLERTFDLHPKAERTLEVNPADVTVERARAWRDLGFNRVSLGVQSFRAQELEWLGRRHDPEQAVAAVHWLRSAGFDNLGLDLVQGLPGQSLDQRLRSLEHALAFDPEHLSCYELTLEADTPLAAEAATGRWQWPDSDTAADAWLANSERLQERGYLHYEVSNFARTEQHRSLHNIKYWRLVPYLGLGPAAHSFAQGRRWSNVRSLSGYCEALESSARPHLTGLGTDLVRGRGSYRPPQVTGKLAMASEEYLTDEQLRWERVAMGLRTSDGIALQELQGTEDAIHSRTADLVERGLVRWAHDRLVATQPGLLLADALARCLLFGHRS